MSAYVPGINVTILYVYYLKYLMCNLAPLVLLFRNCEFSLLFLIYATFLSNR